jgi:hypothetical protein
MSAQLQALNIVFQQLLRDCMASISSLYAWPLEGSIRPTMADLVEGSLAPITTATFDWHFEHGSIPTATSAIKGSGLPVRFPRPSAPRNLRRKLILRFNRLRMASHPFQSRHSMCRLVQQGCADHASADHFA